MIVVLVLVVARIAAAAAATTAIANTATTTASAATASTAATATASVVGDVVSLQQGELLHHVRKIAAHRALVVRAVDDERLDRIGRVLARVVGVESQAAGADEKEHDVRLLGEKGQLTRHELVQHDAVRVHVGRFRVRIAHLLLDDLGRHPQNRSIRCGWCRARGVVAGRVAVVVVVPGRSELGQSEVADLDAPARLGLFGYEEDVVGLEVAVENVDGVQVLHAGGDLFGDVEEFAHLAVVIVHVQVAVERRARTPLGDDGERTLEYAADEEEDVVVARPLEYVDLVLEGARLLRRRLGHVQILDGDDAVQHVDALMHDAERAVADVARAVHADLRRRYLPRDERVPAERLMRRRRRLLRAHDHLVCRRLVAVQTQAATAVATAAAAAAVSTRCRRHGEQCWRRGCRRRARRRRRGCVVVVVVVVVVVIARRIAAGVAPALLWRRRGQRYLTQRQYLLAYVLKRLRRCFFAAASCVDVDIVAAWTRASTRFKTKTSNFRYYILDFVLSLLLWFYLFWACFCVGE